MARVVFLGTPQFGVPVLEALVRHHEVVVVVTQPDRTGGRGREQLYVPAVKRVAEAHGLRVLQPISLRRDTEAVEVLRQAQADVFVIAAFGQILRPKVLAIPRCGCIGVHASLLPKLRGAAPIATAILRGEDETGITLMLTDAGMDSGAIIAQRRVPIASTDTTETLADGLARLGAALLIETLPAWLAGEIEAQPQDETQVTWAPPLAKQEGLIDWTHTARAIDARIRALTPWPGAYTLLAGKSIKLLSARPRLDGPDVALPGTVLAQGEEIAVATGAGLLVLGQVQMAGKKALDACTFARGQRGFVGSVLG
jgi:methionyl-tRNA formyltransferase